ncbi:MAG: hypothetical protein KAS67_02680 [Thermoplasmata archaeon]|nr:hypothetical protein [Thermoplasmata archaeon]
MTKISIKKNRASRTNEGAGARTVAVVMIASLLFLGAGLWTAAQDHVVDTARAPPVGYYTLTGPDGVPSPESQYEPADLQPSPKVPTTTTGGASGFSSGVSHV